MIPIFIKNFYSINNKDEYESLKLVSNKIYDVIFTSNDFTPMSDIIPNYTAVDKIETRVGKYNIEEILGIKYKHNPDHEWYENELDQCNIENKMDYLVLLQYFDNLIDFKV